MIIFILISDKEIILCVKFLDEIEKNQFDIVKSDLRITFREQEKIDKNK